MHSIALGIILITDSEICHSFCIIFSLKFHFFAYFGGLSLSPLPLLSLPTFSKCSIVSEMFPVTGFAHPCLIFQVLYIGVLEVDSEKYISYFLIKNK